MNSARPATTRRGALTTARPAARPAHRATVQAEQLTLLPATTAPLQFRLDDRTRRRGLAHIAAIRQQLAELAEHRGHSSEGAATPSPAAVPAGLHTAATRRRAA